jgi:sugar transferase (PEP-CTERM/EpsH1 system associated)
MASRHAVTVVTFVRNDRDREKCDAIRDLCEAVHMVPFSIPRALGNCIAALPTPLPLRVAYQRNPEMRRRVDTLIASGRFDLVYVKRKRMAQYVLHFNTPRRLLDLTDAVALYYERSLRTVDWLRYPLHLEEFYKIRRYEPKLVPLFDSTVVCSPVDARYLEQQAGRKFHNLRVIPNVVDTDFYQSSSPPTLPEHPVLMFSGLMDKHVNVDAARFLVDEILPHVRRKQPSAELLIVGPKPVAEVRAMGERNGITVTGYVEDLRDYIERASVVLCPVRVGAGTRNKILQAMSMNRPLVSTTLGAEGLNYQDGRDLLIADDAAQFAKHTLSILSDPERQRSLAAAGRQLVESQYSVHVLGDQLDALFREIGALT